MDGRPAEIRPDDPRLLAVASAIRAEQAEEASALCGKLEWVEAYDYKKRAVPRPRRHSGG